MFMCRDWPEKHAHASLGDLALDRLPRPDDREQFALTQRHRTVLTCRKETLLTQRHRRQRKRRWRRRKRSDDDRRRRWADHPVRSTTDTRQPAQQTCHCSRHDRHRVTPTFTVTCMHQHTAVTLNSASYPGLGLGLWTLSILYTIPGVYITFVF